jgi:hypothetical protein
MIGWLQSTRKTFEHSNKQTLARRPWAFTGPCPIWSDQVRSRSSTALTFRIVRLPAPAALLLDGRTGRVLGRGRGRPRVGPGTRPRARPGPALRLGMPRVPAAAVVTASVAAAPALVVASLPVTVPPAVLLRPSVLLLGVVFLSAAARVRGYRSSLPRPGHQTKKKVPTSLL